MEELELQFQVATSCQPLINGNQERLTREEHAAFCTLTSWIERLMQDEGKTTHLKNPTEFFLLTCSHHSNTLE